MASNHQLRQERKIQEICETLVIEGLTTLDKQATALGLVRSTAWFILQAKQKRAGITTATLIRMLQSPHLPQTVREKVLEYVAEKAAGLYGHKESHLRDFKAQLGRYAPTKPTTNARQRKSLQNQREL
jgi:hypothetical protein